MKIPERYGYFLKLLSVPITLFVIYLSMLLVLRIFNLPQGEELLAIIGNYFSRYGLWIIFAGSFIEGFLILGQYFPGGTIIFLGVSTAGNPSRAIAVVITVSVAFLFAYSLNYFLGKHGWYRLLVKFGFAHSLEEAKQKILGHKLKAILLSYWEPNLASITATAAGILQVSYIEFLKCSLLGIMIWNTLWGILVYSLGTYAIKLFGLKYALTAFGVWICILLVKHVIAQRKKLEKSEI